MLKISLAGANNSVPTTGLTPCIIIVHLYTCNYSGAEKAPMHAGISWRHSANSTPLIGRGAPIMLKKLPMPQCSKKVPIMLNICAYYA